MNSLCSALIATWFLLTSWHQLCTSCSPKAVRSVFVGRHKAQLHHEAKKAKYLAGETKTLGQTLGLSKGGVIMEQIGVDRLRSEIKYLESVEKLLKKNAQKEVWLAKQIAKAEARGKPLKGAAAKMLAKKQAKAAKSAAEAIKDISQAAPPPLALGAMVGSAKSSAEALGGLASASQVATEAVKKAKKAGKLRSLFGRSSVVSQPASVMQTQASASQNAIRRLSTAAAGLEVPPVVVKKKKFLG